MIEAEKEKYLLILKEQSDNVTSKIILQKIRMK